MTGCLIKSGFTGSVKGISARLYKDFAEPQKWEVYSDVHTALQQLKNSGIMLGVISNFDERLGQ